MIRSIVSVFLSIMLPMVVLSQTGSSNSNYQWGLWQKAYSSSSGSTFYAVEYSKCSGGGIWGEPRIKLKHDFSVPLRRLLVRLGGYDCSGSYLEMEFSSIDVSPNSDVLKSGNWHLFKSVTGVVRVEISYYKGSDLIQITYDKVKGITETINGRTMAEFQRDKEREAQQKSQATFSQNQNRYGQTEPSGQLGGYGQVFTGGTTSSNSAVQVPAATGSGQTQVKSFFQNQANNNLNSYQSGNSSSLMDALNLQLAKVNAIGAGNQGQVNQIQRLEAQREAQRQFESSQAIANSVVTVFSALQSLSEQRERQRQATQEMMRRYEAEQAEKKRREAEQARVKAAQEAAMSEFYGLFSPKAPDSLASYDEIYYIAATVLEKGVVLADEPMQVSRNLFGQWTPPDKLSNFLKSSMGLSSEVLLAGYFADAMSANSALLKLKEILPSTGRNFTDTRFSLDETALNGYLKEESIREKREAEMREREAKLARLKQSLPSYRYPNSLVDLDKAYFFIAAYTNDTDGLQLGLSTIYDLKRYSDGSWPLKPETDKLLKSRLEKQPYSSSFIVGYCDSLKVKSVYAELVSSFKENNLDFRVFDIDLKRTDQPIMNNDFWKN